MWFCHKRQLSGFRTPPTNKLISIVSYNYFYYFFEADPLRNASAFSVLLIHITAKYFYNVKTLAIFASYNF